MAADATLTLPSDEAAALAAFLAGRPQQEVNIALYAGGRPRIELRWGPESPMYVAFELDPAPAS